MNTVITDWRLQSNYWIVEGHRIDIHAVSVLHPTIQYGIEEDHYSYISSPSFYGVLRSYHPSSMLVTPTEPIMIALEYEDDSLDFYLMDWDRYSELMNWYVGSGIKEPADWKEEGF